MARIPETDLQRLKEEVSVQRLTLDADDQALLAQTIDYYHQRLKETPEALAYLAARGLDHPGLVDAFELGVADRTLGLRLPEKNRKDGAALRERLQRIGILRESGHEHFNGSLVIPVRNAAGQVVEVYGRKLLDNLRPGTPKHLYLPGPHAGVFNLAGVMAAGQRPAGEREVIVCEALLDALTFCCAGYTNVTSAYGVEGFGEEILQAFKANAIERVLIAYDRDEAGDRAAQKLGERLIGEGFEVLRVVFPQGMDANEYARKMPPADKALGLVLRQAQWMGGVRPVEVEVPGSMPMPPAPVTTTAIDVDEELLNRCAASTGTAGAHVAVTAGAVQTIADVDHLAADLDAVQAEESARTAPASVLRPSASRVRCAAARP